MLVKDVIQRIQSLYSKGVQSDDSDLTSRHIYNKMITVRSKLLTLRANKKQTISQWNYQVLSCIELIKAPVHECPCAPPIGCMTYRTKEQLPRPLTGMNGHMLQAVTSITGELIYSPVSWTEKKYKSANKYTGNKPDYFIRNDYLYITHRVGSAKVISIEGLFDNPIDADNYPSICECEDCDECQSPLDKEFPLDLNLIEDLINISVQELLQVFNQSYKDETNDSNDSMIEQTK